jgi:tetratricopeptide (TPR) repeat protein
VEGDEALEGEVDLVPELSLEEEVDLDSDRGERTDSQSGGLMPHATDAPGVPGEFEQPEDLPAPDPSTPEDPTTESAPLPAGHLADPAGATREAIAAEQWTSAQKRAEEWIHSDPGSMEAVEKLIEISEALQDNAAIVRGLVQKGDLLIRDGEFEEALPIFKRALEIDPSDETAQRRMKRFVDLGIAPELADDRPDGDTETPGLVQQVLEAKDAVVAVHESQGEDLDAKGWMDIGALLEEFREGLRNQVADNDVQAHYDLGISHMEMELFEEALEEFDAGLACPDVPQQLQVRMRELRGKSFSKLKRHREAIYEFREALEVEGVSTEDAAGIRYLLACEHESVGEADAARECLREALELMPEFAEAAQLLEALEKGAA